jgi:hypothetical protein
MVRSKRMMGRKREMIVKGGRVSVSEVRVEKKRGRGLIDH